MLEGQTCNQFSMCSTLRQIDPPADHSPGKHQGLCMWQFIAQYQKHTISRIYNIKHSHAETSQK